MTKRYTVESYMWGSDQRYRVYDNRNKCFVLHPCQLKETAQTIADSWNKANN